MPESPAAPETTPDTAVTATAPVDGMAPAPTPDHAPRTVSTAVADVIAERADHLFGLMGNGNAHLVSSLTERGFPFTSARHESATVTMADAFHRAGGGVGVATTTYGAGFTNTYTALAEARLARIPLVLVVGDAPSTGPRFFDIDQVQAVSAVGVTTLTATPQNAEAMAHRAFDLAAQTVQPVVLSLPYDHSTAPLTDPVPLEPLAPKPQHPPVPPQVQAVAERLLAAERPLLMVGRGVPMSGTGETVQRIGDLLGGLFVTTVMASNTVDSPWNLGIAGGFMRTHRWEVAHTADVVLVAGASLNPFQMRHGTLFGPDAHVIRVDNEPGLHHERVDEHVNADLGTFLEALLEAVEQSVQARQNQTDRPDAGSLTWREQVPEVASEDFRGAEPVEDPTEFGPDGRLNPRAVMAALEQILPQDRSVVMDGGHFLGWAPMYLSVPDPHALVMVGTAFQSIGLGLGSAAGVSVARPDRLTVHITGDGGGLMGLADLETFIRTTRRGVMVALNDSAYGAELHQYASKGLHDAAMLIDEVDFSALGRALGAEGVKATTLADLQHLTDWLATDQDGVFVLDVAISQKVVAEFMQGMVNQGKSL
ncbi:thiamine pyrophosphate-binding protein [Micrococcus terreus]|uniref:thiamine pyrophosphate-binding protein n=1 Tax=Micrococcus terreus TaxID=574650 RepID=UPI003D733DBE